MLGDYRQTTRLLCFDTHLPQSVPLVTLSNHTRQHALEIPEDTIQNVGTHGSITGKTMTRIICFDHITTATTPFPNL